MNARRAPIAAVPAQIASGPTGSAPPPLRLKAKRLPVASQPPRAQMFPPLRLMLKLARRASRVSGVRGVAGLPVVMPVPTRPAPTSLKLVNCRRF